MFQTVQKHSRMCVKSGVLIKRCTYFSLGYNLEEVVKEDVPECPGRSLPPGTEQMLLPDPLPQVATFLLYSCSSCMYNTYVNMSILSSTSQENLAYAFRTLSDKK